MRLPRVQFTIRLMMIAIVLASLFFAGISAYRERRQRLVDLQLARAELKVSELTLEFARIAINEYTQGTYPQDLAAVEAGISRAEREWKAAEQVSDEQAMARARSALERARDRKATLEKETKDQQIKALADEVRKAQADESARRATLQRARAAVTRWLW